MSFRFPSFLFFCGGGFTGRHFTLWASIDGFFILSPFNDATSSEHVVHRGISPMSFLGMGARLAGMVAAGPIAVCPTVEHRGSFGGGYVFLLRFFVNFLVVGCFICISHFTGGGK